MFTIERAMVSKASQSSPRARIKGPLGNEIQFCQAQFQLAIAVAIELGLALLSLLNSLSNQPAIHPPGKSIKTALYSSNSWIWKTTSICQLNGRRPPCFLGAKAPLHLVRQLIN
jgi:hypothetical protein